MSRLLIVSNRLPITVKVSEEGDVQIDQSAGGLATGMKGPHERTGGLWIGWSGLTAPLAPPAAEAVANRLSELRAVPVPLSAAEVEAYYEGYSNGVLWPLFHNFVGMLPLDGGGFDTYRQVNERFADVVAAQYREGDVIWVHDYQLMLVPALLRERLPAARIGFFLHIPFPPSELFRTLPSRDALLEGVLGADLVGFHTAEYARNFDSSVLRVLGKASGVRGVLHGSRRVQVGIFPMGVDAEGFASMARQPEVERLVADFRAGVEGQLLVGIDRLDYTKGIPRRLLAFERLLEAYPELRGAVRLVQVAVPSRTSVGAYEDFREQVDALSGRINGRFATPTWVPVHYLFRGLSQLEVVALYRAADVMLVTPIRDGMNLVSKEFVASRVDESGVLVLSELAGAASELAEALHVNPYDIGRTAEAIHRALVMSSGSRRQRMRGLRRRVFAYDVHRWADAFLDRLRACSHDEGAGRPSARVEVDRLVERAAGAGHLVLLLDYDGTLVPIAETPELAAPDEPLLSLLRALAARGSIDVHVVSGRPRASLEGWLGELPVALHAEHGLWSRPQGGEWVMQSVPQGSWRPAATAILEDWTQRTPGSLLEEKTLGLAWHYRMADPEFGLSQANELKLYLGAHLSNAPVQVLHGDKVVELRPQGVDKGQAVRAAAAGAPPGALFIAAGDDHTDQDLFSALPEGGVSVAVGGGPLQAQVRLTDFRAVRGLLARIEKARAGTAG